MTMLFVNDDDINALAASLHPIDPAYVKASAPHLHRHWYQGQESYLDFMVELEEDTIIWAQFTLRGQVLTWCKKGHGLSTGTTDEMGGSNGPIHYPRANMINSEAPFDKDLARVVAQILDCRVADSLCLRVAALIHEALGPEEYN